MKNTSDKYYFKHLFWKMQFVSSNTLQDKNSFLQKTNNSNRTPAKQMSTPLTYNNAFTMDDEALFPLDEMDDTHQLPLSEHEDSENEGSYYFVLFIVKVVIK